MLCGLVCIAMLTSGFSVNNNERVRVGHTPGDTMYQPGPALPALGSDPEIQWSSFNSPDTSNSFIFIETSDLNNDASQDILVGQQAGGLLIWTGDSDGNWASFTPPTGSMISNDASIGDLDNDGKPDITIATTTGLFAWTGDGTGTWTDASNGLPTGDFNSIVMGDVNNDGDLDIIAGCSASPAEKGVQVLLGDGAGNWVHGDNNIPNSFTAQGVDIGDLDNDGDLDIAASRTDGVSTWTGDGTGSWSPSNNGLPSVGSYSDVKMKDMNMDGDLDLVATHDAGQGVRAWSGNGLGVWTMTFNLPFTGTYNSLEVGDANIDGHIDIYAAPTGTNNSIWSGDSQDNWFLQTGGLPAALVYSDISIADIDDDGRLDYIGVGISTGIVIWKADVDRRLNAWSQLVPPSTSSLINDIEVLDVNLDGKLDLCFATDNSGIEIWTGDGTGNWTAFSTPSFNGRFRKVRSVDLNNDGKPDIIATAAPGVKAWIGDGAGGWTQKTNGLPSSGTFDGLTVADFNDDGNMDIAAGSRGNAGITVWNGDGTGVWYITFGLPVTGSYRCLDHADVNHDGNIDLLTVNGTIKVYLGDSNDGWTESSTGLPSTNGEYRDVRLGDVNDDGNADVIVTASDGVHIWGGLGDGTWSYLSNPSTDNSLGLDICDFDIDGSLDIVSGSSTSSFGITPMKNVLPTWTYVTTGLPDGGLYGAMELADIDSDGRMDIITNNGTGDGTGANVWKGVYVPVPLQAPQDPIAELSGTGNSDILLQWTLSSTDIDVVTYNIYRSTSFDANGTGYALIDTMGHGNSGYLDSGAGKGDSNDYFYIIGAVGSQGEYVNATKQAGKISTPVNSGWNLISSPVVQKGTSLGNAYGNINWNHALYYDALAPSNKWVGNITTRPDVLDILDSVGYDMGIWLNVNSNDDLVTAGLVSDNISIELKAGWNLVGYPGLEAKTVLDIKIETGATQIEGFNPANAYLMEILSNSDTMSYGNGYWIKVGSDTTWTINNY